MGFIADAILSAASQNHINVTVLPEQDADEIRARLLQEFGLAPRHQGVWVSPQTAIQFAAPWPGHG